MQLMKKWLIFILILMIPIFGQGKKKELKSKSPKKKNVVEFRNDQNTQEYLNMLEEAFYKVRESYVDSVNESEIIKAGIKGMMKNLDPYTKLLEGSKKESYDILHFESQICAKICDFRHIFIFLPKTISWFQLLQVRMVLI